MRKPVIGITVFKERKTRGVYNSVSYEYADCVIAAGGIPLFIPLSEPENAKDYMDVVDGLIFSGGEDIAPRYFDEEPVIRLGGVDSVRDEFEFALFKAATENHKPILGICRGVQIINVALGGSLYQDIDSQIKNVKGHHPDVTAKDELYHSVNIKPETILSSLFNREKIYVNSFHHQALKELGRNLKVSAISEDGIIEAVEYNDLNEQFIFGVQWHPEGLGRRYPEFIKIFKTLIEKSSN